MAGFRSLNEYGFDLTVTLDPVLGFSSGELAKLIVDGIERLDTAGTLFPGVTDPELGGRIHQIGAKSIGYQRGNVTYWSDHYEQMMTGKGRKRSAAMEPQMIGAVVDLQAMAVTLQMLRAKTSGTAAMLRNGGTPSDLDRAKAQIAAIDRLGDLVEEIVRPLL